MNDDNNNQNDDQILSPLQDDSPVISSDREKSQDEEISQDEAPRDDNDSSIADQTNALEETESVEAVPAETTDEEAGPSKAEIADEEAVQNDSEELSGSEDQNSRNSDSSDQSEDQSLSDLSDQDPNVKWYVVHTYSGHENKVATALKQRVEAEHLEHKILDVLVPTQEKIEIRSGKKASVKEKIFPGYILVKMNLDDTSWLAVRTTQGVTSFVGIGNKPTPIPEAEVRTIVRFMSEGAAPTFKDVFMVDDTVKIVDGPFSEFIGKVDSVDKEHGKVRVLVSIFGRETPVELDFLQIQKL